jgi:hypothetical protein
VKFYTIAGALVDPATVIFAIEREADGETEIFNYVEPDSSSDSSEPEPGEVVRESEGIYYLDIDLSEIGGVWYWRVASEVPRNATQGAFYVVPYNIEDSESSSSS